jgi:4-hydroxy 2-oxovalerate aldolase
MFLEDIRELITVFTRNLKPSIKLDFHSHNNEQLSNALSQEFVRVMQGILPTRDCVVDSTLYGMGRGAGNTPTELIVHYLNTRYGKKYDIDKILDVIDNTILNISSFVKWGYSIPMFLSGAYGSHINNVNYLAGKASLRSQDIRSILETLSIEKRSRYDYEHLDELYLKRISSSPHSAMGFDLLKTILINKPILVIAPGKTSRTESKRINEFIVDKKPTVISINFVPDAVAIDYVYFNNPRRYDYLKNSGKLNDIKKIVTANVIDADTADFVIPLEKIVRNNFDNSTILLLNLLDMCGVSEIAIAGFDGFTDSNDNYASPDFDKAVDDITERNTSIQNMLSAFLEEKSVEKVYFVTPSLYAKILGLYRK